MAAYDIGEAFQIIEEEMIASMARNLKRHLATEKEEGLDYSMWQAEQLAALKEFRLANQEKFATYFSTINDQIGELLKKANENGQLEQEAEILKAIQKGWKSALSGKEIQGNFFRINERKLNALIEATKNDMAKAETAMLRQANDVYRKTIYNAEVFYNTGAGTLSQCVDMATKDFLNKGITCVEYANGRMVGIDVYSRMALRTAQTRAYLQGEATKRDEWGVNTVIVNRRGVACPFCLKWVGQVYYDDVWGNAKIPSPPKYKKLSTAMAGGLYHPNCRDIHTTYFEGVSSKPKAMSQKEIDEANRVYALEQKQRYNERQIRKYKRLTMGSVDSENAVKYHQKLEAWQIRQTEFIKENSDVLKRRPELEKVFKLPEGLQYGHNSYDFSQDIDDIIKHEHNWVEEIVDYPTCVDAGVKVIRCSICGEEKEEIEIPPTGHKWVEEITKQPTCTEAGEKTLRCEYCGGEKTEEIPATGHKWGHVHVVTPTCTDEGYTFKSCLVCGQPEEYDIKPALGHDWSDWVVTKQPTTAADGRKVKTCKRCGKKNYATIKKLKANSPDQQIKALEDSIAQLDTEIAALNQNSYSGIWKDSVTVSDYPAKKSAIAAKKQYFLDKLDEAKTYGLGQNAEDKWQSLIDLTDEFDLKGKEYENLLVQRQKNQDALDLLAPKPATPAGPTGGPFTADAYSKARKDAALWSKDRGFVDGKVRDKVGEIWRKSNSAKRTAAYQYTAGSGPFNRPLRGYQGSWSNFKGVGKVDLNYEGAGTYIKDLTEMINESTYDFDMWVNRGVAEDGAASFLGISSRDLNKSQKELEDLLLGTVRKDEAFMSTGATKGDGFSYNCTFNIYCPKGTKMLYCEPFSCYGQGAGKSWNGTSKQSYFGSEFEMLIQRGTQFKITKVEKQGRKIYFDMEVVGQI